MSASQPQSMGYYTARLKQYLPKEAFLPATYKLWPMTIHAALILSGVVLSAQLESYWIISAVSILMGICMACLFLYCHELTHGTIVKKQPYRYWAEVFYWSFSGMPPTLWEKIHNYNHHKNMNNYDDPDRRTFKSEKNFWNSVYNLFIYPNKTLRFSFTVGFAMILYTAKHILSAFYTEGKKPAIVTYKPSYSKAEKGTIFLEFLFICAIQGTFFAVLGWKKYLFITAISWFVWSAALILFIITQHLRNPNFKDTADPMLTTTSVIIPDALDRLIDRHSFHVEHHIFPGINFDYYPLISEKLREDFPDKYERIPLWQGVKEAYSRDVFEDDPLT